MLGIGGDDEEKINACYKAKNKLQIKKKCIATQVPLAWEEKWGG